MYIKSIQLQNIKRFENIKYEFKKKGASLVLAGDNGDGKSTILRSIAISLCDRWTAAGLLRELSGELVSAPLDIPNGKIVLELLSGRTLHEITTTIQWNAKEMYEFPDRVIKTYKNDKLVTPPYNDENFPWEKIFATGYGAGLRVIGNQDFQDYFTGDSLYSLFRYDTMLQNPELALRRIKDTVTKRNGKNKGDAIQNEIVRWLADLLLLKPKQLQVKANGIQIIKEYAGRKISVPLASSGDGFQAITSVVLDMLAWWFLFKFYDSNNGNLRTITITAEGLRNIEGIVIIDEIEQHLHPRWQREILPRLKASFPKVQFIISTHSPLVLSSTEEESLILLENEQYFADLSGWRAGEVLKIMGAGGTRGRPKALSDQIMRYKELYLEKLDKGKLSPKKARELGSLERKFDNHFDASMEPFSSMLQMEITEEFLRS